MKTLQQHLLVPGPDAADSQNSASPSTDIPTKTNKVTFREDSILLDIDYQLMSSSNAGGDDSNFPDESKKSERKRKRERQRRSDLANAFDELGTLLSSMDQDPGDTSHARRRRRRSSMDDASEAEHAEGSGMTRLDLITRSIDAIKRLQGENDELKRQLEQQRGGGEVYVMLPTLTPVDQDDSSPGSRASYQTPPYYQQPHSSTHQPVQPMGTGSHDFGYYPGAAHHGNFSYGGQQPPSGWGNQPMMMMQQQQQPYHARYPAQQQYQQQPYGSQHPESHRSSTHHDPGPPDGKPPGAT